MTSDVAPRVYPTEPDHVDVLIVGAGLSGIGAACRLSAGAPRLTFEILEARGASGGTWDLFRYPGVRSDSDMFTLGFPFQPWPGTQSLADGGDILAYLRQTAADHGVEDRIAYYRRVVRADWSTEDARWTVTVEDTHSGTRRTRTCGFLYLCTGYYRYDHGYMPSWPGLEEYAGTLIHPQQWPEDLDVTGKRVLVIGSGATAVTLVPALAAMARKVTMVQRSPSYVMALPTHDPVAAALRALLPTRLSYKAVRWKNAKIATGLYVLCRKYPARMRAVLRKAAVKRLPAGYDVDTHFNPAYQPWDQRMCLVPDGDLFEAIRTGAAETVTDHIEAFTESGVRLRSGRCLEADVVVSATGLNLLPLGGIAVSVDGLDVQLPQRVAYKGMMLDGVPNLAFTLGYTNASWTLKADLVWSWVARLLSFMEAGGHVIVTPRLPEGPINTAPFIEMSSGYFERSRDALPLQGDKAPWRLRQHYFKDAALFRGPVDAPELEFQPAAGVAEATR